MSQRSQRGTTEPVSADEQDDSAMTNAKEVTVEYIKENDFGPLRLKKYCKSIKKKSKRNVGKGYYVTKESEAFVRRFVEETSRPGTAKKRQFASAQAKKKGLDMAMVVNTTEALTPKQDEASTDIQSLFVTRDSPVSDMRMISQSQLADFAPNKNPRVPSPSAVASPVVRTSAAQSLTPGPSSTSQSISQESATSITPVASEPVTSEPITSEPVTVMYTSSPKLLPKCMSVKSHDSPAPVVSAEQTAATVDRPKSVSSPPAKFIPHARKSVVADTISSLVNLFGERKRQQMTTPRRPAALSPGVKAAPATRTALRHSVDSVARTLTAPTPSTIIKKQSSPMLSVQKSVKDSQPPILSPTTKIGIVRKAVMEVASPKSNSSEVSATKARIAQRKPELMASPKGRTDSATQKTRIAKSTITEFMSPVQSSTNASATQIRIAKNGAIEVVSPRSDGADSSTTKTNIVQKVTVGGTSVRISRIELAENKSSTNENALTKSNTIGSSIKKTRIARKIAGEVTSPKSSAVQRVAVCVTASGNDTSASPGPKSRPARSDSTTTETMPKVSQGIIAEGAVLSEGSPARLSTTKTDLIVALDSTTEGDLPCVPLVKMAASGKSEPASKPKTSNRRSLVAAPIPISAKIKDQQPTKPPDEGDGTVESKLPLTVQGSKRKSLTTDQKGNLEENKARTGAVRKKPTQVKQCNPQISLSLKEKLIKKIGAQSDVRTGSVSANQPENTLNALSCDENVIELRNSKQDEIIENSPKACNRVGRKRTRTTDCVFESDTQRKKPATEIVRRPRRGKSATVVKTFALRCRQKNGKGPESQKATSQDLNDPRKKDQQELHEAVTEDKTNLADSMTAKEKKVSTYERRCVSRKKVLVKPADSSVATGKETQIRLAKKRALPKRKDLASSKHITIDRPQVVTTVGTRKKTVLVEHAEFPFPLEIEVDDDSAPPSVVSIDDSNGEVTPDVSVISVQDEEDAALSVVSISDRSEVVLDDSIQGDTDDNQSWQDDRSVCSVVSDQSSISEFSFRTPLPKEKGRRKKRKSGHNISSERTKMSSLDDSGPLDDSPASTPSRRSARQRVSSKMLSESYSTYSTSPEPEEESEGTPTKFVNIVEKVSCPGCGVLYHPTYLKIHMARRCPNITPKPKKVKPATPTVKPDTPCVESDTPSVEFDTPSVKSSATVPSPMSVDTPAERGSGTNSGKCFSCGKFYKGRLRFHEKWCGREKEKLTCTNCGARILISKFERHTGLCTEPPRPDAPLINPSPDLKSDDKSDNQTKPRRAACKALTTIQSFISKRDKTKPQKKLRFVLPKGKQITAYFLKKWDNDLQNGGVAECPLVISGCLYMTDSIEVLSKHYLHCRFHSLKKTYKCIRCENECLTVRQAKKHARTHDWSDASSSDDSDSDSAPDDEDNDPDAKFSSSNSESDKDEHSLEKSRQDGHTTKGRKNLIRPRPLRDRSTENRSLARTYAERLEMFQDAMQWTLDWRKGNEPAKLDAMAAWAPRTMQWCHLTADEADRYLPTSKVSPWFCFSANGTSSPQATLGLFESIKEPMTVLNAGGPVWSLDWLPTPIGEDHMQYLAIYAHRNHDLYHSVQKAVSGPACIQIWQCGTMRHSKVSAVPKLSLVLAHNDGPIWCMKWCPRRHWSREKSSGDHLPWLGTLAVATSNGKVNIYSIPVPESVPRSPDGYALPVYKVSPVLTLELRTRFREGCTPAGTLTSCRCLDWQVIDGCRRLLAGYAGGHVALYDVLTSSPLLLTSATKANQPDVLRPLVSFCAHGCPVTSLAFCQRRPNFFSSVSQDRVMKVWNIDHLDYPVNSSAKSEYTKVVWPLHWAAIFTATDNCFCLEHNALFMIDSGYFGIQNRPLTVHNGCIMDVSFSEWLNTVISVDSAGIVEAMYLPYLMLTHKHHKSFSTRRMVMFSSINTPLSTCECAKPRPDPTRLLVCTGCSRPLPAARPALRQAPLAGGEGTSGKDEDGARSPTLLASVCKVMRTMEEEVTSLPLNNVSDMKRHYAVTFEDKLINALNTSKDTRIRTAKDLPADVLMPPLAAQNKVEWNPNLGSHLWTAIGGEAGFVRLVFLSVFGSAKERDFVQTVFNKRKGKSSVVEGSTGGTSTM